MTNIISFRRSSIGSSTNMILTPNVTIGKTRFNIFRVSSLNASTLPTPTPPTPLRTFYVDAVAGNDSNPGTQGSPFQTLSKVRTHAIAGDRFYLKGTFVGESINRLGVVSASGTSTNPIQIVLWPGETATLSGGGGASAYPAIYGNATMQHWWFIDLAIAPVSDMRGFSGSGASFCTFINCTFTPTGTPAGAVLLTGNPDFSFYECTFTGTYGTLAGNSGDVVFVMNGSHRVLLCRCDFNVSSYHVAVTLGGFQNAGDATSTDARISYCTFQNPVAGGININGKGDRTIIEECDFSNIATTSSVPSRSPILVAAPNCVVKYNRIWNCGREGVKIQAYSFASFIQTPSGSHIYNNTMFDIDGMGIFFAVSNNVDPNIYLTDITVENNIGWKLGQSLITSGTAGEEFGWFQGTWYPIWINLYNTTEKFTSGSLGGCIIRNNSLARSTSNSDKWVLHVRVHDLTNVEYTLSEFQSTYTGQVDNIEKSDPMFTSEITPVFTLQPGSPAIDAGYNINGISYNGTALDIGAYEST